MDAGGPQPFSFDVERREDRVVLRLTGDLDMAEVEQLKEVLRTTRADEEVETVIDLRNLSFLDSSGLSALLEAQSAAHESGRRVSLIRGPRQVHRVFEITGTDTRFDWTEPPD